MLRHEKRRGLERREYIPLFLIVLMFAIGSFSYHNVPDRIPTHWNAKGEIDGYSGKAGGLFLMPIITLVLYIGLSFVPYLASYRQEVKSFHFLLFIVKMILIAFMLLLYILTLMPAYGYGLDMNIWLAPLFALMFYGLGHLIGNAKRNYFIGIRTPWTLASDEVWEKTNKRGGILFKLSALLIAIYVMFSSQFIIPMMALIILLGVYLVFYSYLLHKKIMKR